MLEYFQSLNFPEHRSQPGLFRQTLPAERTFDAIDSHYVTYLDW